MYHSIVRKRVVGLFTAVTNGNARPVLEGLAPRFEHFFLGDHALGGSRFTLEKARLWYEPDFGAALEHSSRSGLAGK